MNPPALPDLKRLFQQDQFAARSNIELLAAGPGRATAKMTLHPHHLNGLKTVHGGAIFTLADFAFAVASNSHGTVAVALDVSIVFMKAATTGTLWAEAREASRTFKVGLYLVEVKDDAGDLVAQFQGLAYRKKDRLRAFLPLRVLQSRRSKMGERLPRNIRALRP
jgi:acyl-CoA thioesterase